MKTSLDHLPPRKRNELERATEIVREACAPEMIILFGSYARGDWVEELAEDETNYRYQSDFDLLVVTDTERKATRIEQDNDLWKQLHRSLRTPVSLIAEDIQFINRRLGKAQYFYVDIRKEGVVLYDSGRIQLAEPRELGPLERKHLAEEDFAYWFEKAEKQFKIYRFCMTEADYPEAAFELHQCVERLYAAVLLVFTRYKPSTHDLKKLSERAASVLPSLVTIFPKATALEQHRFDLLRDAYVQARYKPSYRIEPDDLTWLEERVSLLIEMVERECRKRIARFDEEHDNRNRGRADSDATTSSDPE